jgi:hypothetical protein
MSSQEPVLDDGRAAVRTHAVRVRVFVRNGIVVEGNAHIKPGAYQRRVSDVLNLGKLRYIAITDATYTPQNADPVATECVLINADDIVLLDVTVDELPQH